MNDEQLQEDTLGSVRGSLHGQAPDFFSSILGSSSGGVKKALLGGIAAMAMKKFGL